VDRERKRIARGGVGGRTGRVGGAAAPMAAIVHLPSAASGGLLQHSSSSSGSSGGGVDRDVSVEANSCCRQLSLRVRARGGGGATARSWARSPKISVASSSASTRGSARRLARGGFLQGGHMVLKPVCACGDGRQRKHTGRNCVDKSSENAASQVCSQPGVFPILRSS
jgi:hypothetical protein